MKHVLSASIAVALLVLALSGSAMAADDTQSYGVTVSSNITITAPVAASITHDATDANQAFTAQSWTVACNDAAGGGVVFAVSAPFVHGTDSSYKADVELALSISSSDAEASWSVTTASDQTDCANTTPVNEAQVEATSTDAGNAILSLTVTFVQSDYSILAAGDYSVTVTGTVTAN